MASLTSLPALVARIYPNGTENAHAIDETTQDNWFMRGGAAPADCPHPDIGRIWPFVVRMAIIVRALGSRKNAFTPEDGEFVALMTNSVDATWDDVPAFSECVDILKAYETAFRERVAEKTQADNKTAMMDTLKNKRAALLVEYHEAIASGNEELAQEIFGRIGELNTLIKSGARPAPTEPPAEKRVKQEEPEVVAKPAEARTMHDVLKIDTATTVPPLAPDQFDAEMFTLDDTVDFDEVESPRPAVVRQTSRPVWKLKVVRDPHIMHGLASATIMARKPQRRVNDDRVGAEVHGAVVTLDGTHAFYCVYYPDYSKDEWYYVVNYDLLTPEQHAEWMATTNPHLKQVLQYGSGNEMLDKGINQARRCFLTHSAAEGGLRFNLPESKRRVGEVIYPHTMTFNAYSGYLKKYITESAKSSVR